MEGAGVGEDIKRTRREDARISRRKWKQLALSETRAQSDRFFHMKYATRVTAASAANALVSPHYRCYRRGRCLEAPKTRGTHSDAARASPRLRRAGS